MKTIKMLWNNFKIAFAMFSKIPMPMADWSKENMKYMLCFFPFVGAVIGALTLLWGWGAARLGYGVEFTAAVMIMLPILVTGGIHVDGLLDTSDALSSWRDRKRRLEILKDSHAGAFAIIIGCVYFLLWFGAMTEVCFIQKDIILIAISYMLSRSLSGFGVVVIPKASEEGTVAEFSRKSEDKVVRNLLVCYILLLGALLVWVDPVRGSLVWLSALAIWGWYYQKAMKFFGGTTGDLSGFFLCICEAGIVVVLALLERVLFLI